MDQTAPPAKPSRSRLLVAAVALLLVGTVGALAVRGWRQRATETGEGGEFAAAAAETEATDPGWRWEALSAGRPRPPAGTGPT